MEFRIELRGEDRPNGAESRAYIDDKQAYPRRIVIAFEPDSYITDEFHFDPFRDNNPKGLVRAHGYVQSADNNQISGYILWTEQFDTMEEINLE